jgi:NAD(P)-dependent dehydrogenase (short-subunit alcohol dehydrogenase family)
MENEFTEQLAVVTGGASGIGAACAELLATRGCQVVVADIATDAATAVAQRIGAQALTLDVASESSVENNVAQIWREVGAVDILVTSAGIIQRPLPPNALPLEDWDQVVKVDQRGTYLSCLAFGKRMAQRGRGAIVNIASIVGMRSAPLHAYAPAKAAVINMTACLAAEWGRSGVRVNAVSPGYTRTPAVQGAIDRGDRDPSALEETSALGRMVEPNEVAKAVAFLASPQSAAITGINLPVDAGWLSVTPWITYGGVRPPTRS